jgi:hypothetical protein
MTLLTWHFTGSIAKQPDLEKDEKVYGDLTGTFFRSSCHRLQLQVIYDEGRPNYKLETDTGAAEGRTVKPS